jgi:phage-related holin
MPGAKICFFGTLVTVWLILNEVVSILENLSEVGVPLPSFLKKITEKLKKTAEQTAEHTK